MQEQQQTSIEGNLIDLSQMISQKRLSEAAEVIFVAANNEAKMGPLCTRICKLDQKDQTSTKAGVPKFRTYGQNSLLVDFGKQLLSSPNGNTPQAMLNLVYVLNAAPRIKIILGLQADQLKNKHISALFRSLIQTFQECPNLDALIHNLKNSIELCIIGAVNNQVNSTLSLLTNFSKTIQMNSDSQCQMKWLIDAIVSNQHIIADTLSTEKIRASLDKFQPYTFNQQTLSRFLSEKVRLNQSLKQLMGPTLSTYRNYIGTLMPLVQEKLQIVLDKGSGGCEKQIESIIKKIKIKYDFKKIRHSNRKGDDYQPILYLRVVSILRELLKLVLAVHRGQEKAPVSKILEIIFKRRIAHNKSLELDEKIYNICVISALIHNAMPLSKDDLEHLQLQKETLEEMLQTIIQRFNNMLFKWIENYNKSYPMQTSQLLRVLNDTTCFIQQLEQMLSTQPNLMYEKLSELETDSINTEIEVIRLKYIYFKAVEEHMNNQEKLDFVIEWEKSIRKVSDSDHLNVANKEISFIVKKIYDVMGIYLMSKQKFYYAIQLYSSMFMIEKLLTACHQYLTKNLESIQVSQFKKIFLHMHNNGIVEGVRTSLYRYLELPNNRDREEICQLLLDSLADQEGNSDIYMSNFKTGKTLRINLLDKNTMKGVIKQIRDDLQQHSDVLTLNFKL